MGGIAIDWSHADVIRDHESRYHGATSGVPDERAATVEGAEGRPDGSFGKPIGRRPLPRFYYEEKSWEQLMRG